MNSSTAAAGIALQLAPGTDARTVCHWLRSTAAGTTAPPLAALATADEAQLHTDCALIGQVLRSALAASPLPPGVTAPTVGGGVKAANNVRSRLQPTEAVLGYENIMNMLAAARTPEACAPGSAPMADLLAYHGEGDGKAGGAARQHRQQCGHAELVVAGMLLAPLVVGQTWWQKREAPPGPQKQCLLLVVSRACCNSCRYALPHLARLLRVDIVAQFRTRAGELSDPVLFHQGNTPPTKQVVFSPPPPPQ